MKSVIILFSFFIWVQGFAQYRGTTDSLAVAEFLKVYNTGKFDSIKAYMVKKHKAEDSVQILNRSGYVYDLYREYGPLCLKKSFDDKWWFWAPVLKNWLGFKLAFIDDSNEVIDWLAIDRGTIPLEYPLSTPLNETDIAKHLHNYFENIDNYHLFSGVVVIAHKGNILFEVALGESNKRYHVLNTIDTKFDIASVNKSFIGVAILHLIEKGKLSLDDKLEELIPEYPNKIAKQVNLRNLLNHTSGIEIDDYPPFNEAVKKASSGMELLQAQIDYITHLNNGYKDFSVSDSFDYSSEGFDLLGIIIEKVTGMRWEDYLRESIFVPSGIINAGFDYRTSPINLAVGYTSRTSLPGDSKHESTWLKPFYARPSGAMYMTGSDLVKFGNKLSEGYLIDEKRFMEIYNDSALIIDSPEYKYNYSMGFEINKTAGHLVIGHSGGSAGTSARFDIYPKEDYVVVVLSNMENSAHRVADHIYQLITGVGINSELLNSSNCN